MWVGAGTYSVCVRCWLLIVACTCASWRRAMLIVACTSPRCALRAMPPKSRRLKAAEAAAAAAAPTLSLGQSCATHGRPPVFYISMRHARFINAHTSNDVWKKGKFVGDPEQADNEETKHLSCSPSKHHQPRRRLVHRKVCG